MAKQQIIILSMLLIVFYGCGSRSSNEQHKKQDSFYTITGGWDWVRVPLLKPYEVIKVDPKIKTNHWGIEFYHSLGADNVKRVDVQDYIVFILSGKVDERDDSTLVNLHNVPTGWFVINTKNKTEKGFDSEDEFKQYIQENNYPLPQWHDIDSLSEALAEGGQVPWMPK